jgi:restriction system protein
MNEGASKGILVTTSGYGKSAFEFANDKPLELLDGANPARSTRRTRQPRSQDRPPDDWRDPKADTPE